MKDRLLYDNFLDQLAPLCVEGRDTALLKLIAKTLRRDGGNNARIELIADLIDPEVAISFKLVSDITNDGRVFFHAEGLLQ